MVPAPFLGRPEARGQLQPCSPHSALPQDCHLPLSFHRRQEELKFSLGLQRLQHRVREIQVLRDGPAGEGPGQDGSLLGVGLLWGAAKAACPPGVLRSAVQTPPPSVNRATLILPPQPLCS